MSTDVVRIAHLSDPHFGTTTHAKVTALLTALKSLRPDLVALTGDITQRARRRQFKEARAFCNALAPIDTIAVPGNHDIPLFNLIARSFWPYRGFRSIFGFSTSTIRSVGLAQVVALDTTNPLRLFHGELKDSEALKLRLFSPDALLRIAMFHHPMDCASATDEKNLLKASAFALSTLEDAHVDLVIGGHIHTPLARLSSERYPGVKRPFVIDIAGTCLSNRTRAGAPNSFNVIEIERQGIGARLSIIRHDLAPEGRFRAIAKTTFWREGRDLWQQE